MTRPDLDLEVGLAASYRAGDDWLVGLEVCDWLVGLEVCDARKPEYLPGYRLLRYLTGIRGVHGPVGPIITKILVKVDMESTRICITGSIGTRTRLNSGGPNKSVLNQIFLTILISIHGENIRRM